MNQNQPEAGFHGSDLEKVKEQYGLPKLSIVPFASNVNPLGLSPKARKAYIKNIDCLQDYPERDYKKLRKAIAAYCGASEETITISGGGTELIRRLIDIVKPTKAMIINPTYSEYRRDLGIEDSKIVNYQLKEENNFKLDVDDLLANLDDSFKLLVICNPNNPTSSVIYAKDMERIVLACRKLGIFVMVDETYIEFVDDMEEITAIPIAMKYNNICIIRGVSKFFASPGLRLGYGITSNKSLHKKMTEEGNPWGINNLAATAGPAMFSDEEYIEKTKNLIRMERSLCYASLTGREKIKAFEPKANFILLKILRDDITAQDVFEYCLGRGYMIRNCSDFIGLDNHYIRFCFMESEQDDLLVNTILDYVENGEPKKE